MNTTVCKNMDVKIYVASSFFFPFSVVCKSRSLFRDVYMKMIFEIQFSVNLLGIWPSRKPCIHESITSQYQ